VQNIWFRRAMFRPGELETMPGNLHKDDVGCLNLLNLEIETYCKKKLKSVFLL